MVKIHSTAEVDETAQIGEHTSIWNQSQVRNGVRIGQNCILGKNVFIDSDVSIGNYVKLQNNCSVYHGSELEDGVMLGHNVILTNYKYPRAINPDGTLKTADDWEVGPILIKYGASIGAGSIVLPNVTIGRFALIGAGSIVTKNVNDFELGYGNPFTVKGFVCKCGKPLLKGTSCSICEVSLNKDGAISE